MRSFDFASGCAQDDMSAAFFDNQGTSFSVLLTDRFSVRDVLGKTLIIHRNPDDFTTQPSGNAGTKIACGVIQPTRRCN